VTLTFDLLTSRWRHGSPVSLATFLSISACYAFPFSTYGQARDRQTDRQTMHNASMHIEVHQSIMHSPYGGGGIIMKFILNSGRHRQPTVQYSKYKYNAREYWKLKRAKAIQQKKENKKTKIGCMPVRLSALKKLLRSSFPRLLSSNNFIYTNATVWVFLLTRVQTDRQTSRQTDRHTKEQTQHP